MISKTALTMLIGSLAVASASGAFAQSTAPVVPPAQDGKPMQPGMMMNGQGGMKGMMMNDQMMQQMTKMMENCNKMMETMMQNQPAGSGSFPRKG